MTNNTEKLCVTCRRIEFMKSYLLRGHRGRKEAGYMPIVYIFILSLFFYNHDKIGFVVELVLNSEGQKAFMVAPDWFVSEARYLLCSYGWSDGFNLFRINHKPSPIFAATAEIGKDHRGLKQVRPKRCGQRENEG